MLESLKLAWAWLGAQHDLLPFVAVNANLHKTNPNAVLCHSFVRDGRIEFLSDCSHAMAGQTVDLAEVE